MQSIDFLDQESKETIKARWKELLRKDYDDIDFEGFYDKFQEVMDQCLNKLGFSDPDQDIPDLANDACEEVILETLGWFWG